MSTDRAIAWTLSARDARVLTSLRASVTTAMKNTVADDTTYIVFHDGVANCAQLKQSWLVCDNLNLEEPALLHVMNQPEPAGIALPAQTGSGYRDDTL